MALPKEDPLVDQYFQDIKDSVGLSAAEEVELARRIREGDEDALSELVQANLRFVVTVAKRYQNLGLPLSDLINIGNVGLIVAAKRFDGSRGFKFISYAVWWIRQSILQALAEQSRVVRLPSSALAELSKINKVLGRLEQELGYQPRAGEVARELKISQADIDQYLGLAQSSVSLDDGMDGEDSERIGDSMPDEDAPAVDDELSREEMKSNIRRALHTLTDSEARVITMYYGLDGRDSLALEAIGEHFGLTRERIRQIKERALQKLRHSSRSRHPAGIPRRLTPA